MDRVTFSCLLLALCGLPSPGFSADWPQWRGPERNGQVQRDVPFTDQVTTKERWQAELGTGFSSIVVANGHVISSGNTDNQDTIWCLSLTDGTVQWKHTYAAPLDPNLFEGGPTATPTIADESVFIISRTGEVFCLNLESGEVRWQVQVPEELKKAVPSWGFSGSPLVMSDRIYLNVGSHGLCLNAGSGEVIWQSDAEEMPGYTSPLLMQTEQGPCILLETEKSIVAVNPDDGTVLFRSPWITRYGINAADPLIVNDHQLLITSGYAKGASLFNIAKGSLQEVWRIRDLRTQMSPGVLIDGFVYANDGDADRDCKLVCIHAETGKLRWLERGFGSASLIAAGHQLLLLSESGELVIVNATPEKLDVVARFPILSGKCWTPPTSVDSLVLARNAAGKLVCVELQQESL